MTIRSVIAASVVLLVSGCGQHLPELVPVSGRVQFEGGPPPMKGTVNFMPVEAASGLPMRPASGTFSVDGSFQASAFHGAKGLVPGRYHVRIECFAYQPAPVPGDYEKANHVPFDYQPPDLVIEKGGRGMADLLYNVPRKKTVSDPIRHGRVKAP